MFNLATMIRLLPCDLEVHILDKVSLLVGVGLRTSTLLRAHQAGFMHWATLLIRVFFFGVYIGFSLININLILFHLYLDVLLVLSR